MNIIQQTKTKETMENLELDLELYATIKHNLTAADADWDYFCSVNY